MRNTRYARFAIRVALFYFTFAAFCQSIHAQSEIQFRLTHGTVIIVSLMANEEGPYDFILDTGTNTTVVDSSLARELSLVPLDRIQLENLAGSQAVIRSSMRTLAAGPFHVEDLKVLVKDLSELRKVDSHIVGIAGQNFLSHFNYLLDYRRRSISVEVAHEIRDAIEGNPVPVELTDNKIMVASEAQSPDRTKLRLVLDSGANLVVLIRKSSRSLVLTAQESWLGATSSGQVGMQVGRIHTLTVGSQQFHDIAVALSTAETSLPERIEDGVLPTALFRALYVNNREGFVVFNPRAKKN